MDVDTRLLRYFAAVAAEGNLTRAAERLFVSQPALSKQIKQLEAQLDVQLFVRSKAGMTLTEPGRVLADRVPALLAGWDQGLRETRSVASKEARVLRIGFVAAAANESTQSIIAEFARRRPGWRVDMRKTDWSDPTAGLADAEVDAAFLRLPFPGQEALHMEVLLTEPRWVALPTAHPLAGRDRLAFHELRDEPFVAGPPESGRAREHWLATDECGGHETRIGAIAHNADEWLTAIANGYGIALAPEGVTRFYTRPGITYRPVTGVSPSQLAIVWEPANDANPIVQDFIQCCTQSRPPPQHGTT